MKIFGFLVLALLAGPAWGADLVSQLWQIGSSGGGSVAAISPDGNRVAVVNSMAGYPEPSQTSVQVYDVPTGGLVGSFGFRGPSSQFPVALGNGNIAYYAVPTHGIWQLNYITDVRTQLTDGDSPYDLHISPDGQWLAYLIVDGSAAPTSLNFVQLSSLNRLTVPLSGYGTASFQWFPDSTGVALPGPNVYEVDGTHKLTRSADLTGQPFVGPDNKTVYIYNKDSHTVSATKIGAGLLWSATLGESATFNPVISHDGTTFIATNTDTKAGYLITRKADSTLQVVESKLVLPPSGRSSVAVLDPNRNALFVERSRPDPNDPKVRTLNYLERLTFDQLNGAWTVKQQIGDSGLVGGAKVTVSSDGGLTTSIAEMTNEVNGWAEFRSLQTGQMTSYFQDYNDSYAASASDDDRAPGIFAPDGGAAMSGDVFYDLLANQADYDSDFAYAEAISDNGRGVWRSSTNGSLKVAQFKKGVESTLLTRPASAVSYSPRPALTDTGNRLALYNPSSQTIEIWDVIHGNLVSQVPRPAVLGTIFLRDNYLGIQSFASGTDAEPQGNQTLSLYTLNGTFVKSFTQTGVANPDPYGSARKSIAQISFDGNWVAMATSDAQPEDDPNLYSIVEPSLWLIRVSDGFVVRKYRGGPLGTPAHWLDFSRNNQRLAVQTSGSTLFAFELPRILSGLSLSASTVEGGNSVQGTVTLAEPAPTGGTVVSLAATPNLVTMPATVRVAKGATTATFTITANAVGTTTDVSIQATLDSLHIHSTLTISP